MGIAAHIKPVCIVRSKEVNPGFNSLVTRDTHEPLGRGVLYGEVTEGEIIRGMQHICKYCRLFYFEEQSRSRLVPEEPRPDSAREPDSA